MNRLSLVVCRQSLKVIFLLFIFTTIYNRQSTNFLYAAKKLQDPDSPAVNKDFAEANALLSKGDYTGALDKLTAVLIKDPGNGIAREQVYQIAQLIGANAAMMSQILPHPLSEDDRDDAVELAYKSLRKASPRMIERRLQEASIQEKHKHFLLACQAYLALLQLPGLELEKKYSIEKRLRAASQKVDTRIDNLAEDYRGFYREAFTLMNVGDWDGSVEGWQRFLDRGGKDPEVQKLLNLPEAKVVIREKDKINQGMLALRNGENDKAEGLFQEALKMNPNSSEAEKGMEQVRKAQDDSKKDEMVAKLVTDAEGLLHKNQKYRALQLLSEALKDNPSNRKVLAMIQDIMENPGAQKTVIVNRPVIQRVFVEKPAEKEEDKIQTVRDTGRAETHYQKGLVYYSLRNYREALNEWKVAVQYDPNSRKITQALQRVQSDLQFEKSGK